MASSLSTTCAYTWQCACACLGSPIRDGSITGMACAPLSRSRPGCMSCYHAGCVPRLDDPGWSPEAMPSLLVLCSILSQGCMHQSQTFEGRHSSAQQACVEPAVALFYCSIRPPGHLASLHTLWVLPVGSDKKPHESPLAGKSHGVFIMGALICTRASWTCSCHHSVQGLAEK